MGALAADRCAPELRRTPLWEEQRRWGAKLVPFAGWELPLHYGSQIEEHLAVRRAAGLFDVSHMGEIRVQGPAAEEALDYLTCNALRPLAVGRAQYSALLNEDGGVVDDIIVYRLASDSFLLCVNAVNCEKDLAWLQGHNRWGAEISDVSHEYAQLALQGPAAEKIAVALLGTAAAALKTFHFQVLSWQGVDLILARTGYTGEDGFEIFVPPTQAVALWEALLAAGAPWGLRPAGLGARDTLRLEAALPLHGHELREDISALESGLGWIVKFGKGDFCGAAALQRQKQAGVPRTLAALVVEDAGLLREGVELFDQEGQALGVVSSGTKTPTLGRAVALALIKTAAAAVGTTVWAKLRGRPVHCTVVAKPLYRRSV